jgi:GNAT superfamily N-acetyltransferase
MGPYYPAKTLEIDHDTTGGPACVNFTIRSARPEDIAVIHALVLALAEFEHLTHVVVATATDLHRALFGSPARAEALVAEAAAGPGAVREVVAFALFFHNYSTFLGRPGLYLEDLFVSPGHRRKGIARAMLARLASIAVARGCGRFEWSVLDWNSGAIAFYEGLGAKVLPDWRIVRMTGDPLQVLAASASPDRGTDPT